ncbi:Hypothetical predicted protein [Mytilus galloprovincialis]|uniref:Uncharacterized protein n=1 Tax=Mytilus galloprovincialis TaxID=29158 RepID=A0A8B6DM34_MYTGA|nr:Hypothetical predicted protein [Mytilus galloprovincialis]
MVGPVGPDRQNEARTCILYTYGCPDDRCKSDRCSASVIRMYSWFTHCALSEVSLSCGQGSRRTQYDRKLKAVKENADNLTDVVTEDSDNESIHDIENDIDKEIADKEPDPENVNENQFPDELNEDVTDQETLLLEPVTVTNENIITDTVQTTTDNKEEEEETEENFDFEQSENLYF